MGDDVVVDEKEKELRQKIIEVRMAQVYYMMEHKEESPELIREMNEAKKAYGKYWMEKGESNNVERKRK